MVETLLARTALGGTALRTRGNPALVMLREISAATMIDLRLDPAGSDALVTAQSILALDLPMLPGSSVAGESRVAWWFGPDQWLIVAPPAESAALMQALPGAAISAVNVSDLRAEFELAGPRATDVLRKGCPIDLHARVFKPGDCVLTSLARVRVGIRQTDDRPAYRLLVERSVALYLWDWLVDAMREIAGT